MKSTRFLTRFPTNRVLEYVIKTALLRSRVTLVFVFTSGCQFEDEAWMTGTKLDHFVRTNLTKYPSDPSLVLSSGSFCILAQTNPGKFKIDILP